MNKYCYIKDGVVITIENEFIDIFPNIHISNRYSKEFINNCIVVDETVEVVPGMLYEDGVFKEAPIPEPIPEPEPEPLTPSQVEEINNRLDQQDAVIEEILFDMIPSMMEVLGGE